MDNKYLIVIGGPTASGKTATAIEIAKYFESEIISADSRQFYREMNIGTAKPTTEEQSIVPHHFINSLSIGEQYTVGDFERDAISLLNHLFKNNKYAVMTGGSGLFIKAVCEGMDEFPHVPQEIKNKLESEYRMNGISPLQEELQAKDPLYFTSIDINNPHRLLRALSVIRASGRPFSSFRTNYKVNRPFETIYILLDLDRETLYQRINERVDKMIEQGQLEEAKRLVSQKHLNALQTVGYQELFDHFDGKTSLAEAIELIKQNTRRYAKRQMTWFRRDLHWTRFSPSEIAKMLDFIKTKFT